MWGTITGAACSSIGSLLTDLGKTYTILKNSGVFAVLESLLETAVEELAIILQGGNISVESVGADFFLNIFTSGETPHMQALSEGMETIIKQLQNWFSNTLQSAKTALGEIGQSIVNGFQTQTDNVVEGVIGNIDKPGSTQYVSWMNETTYNQFYANNSNATLGATGGSVWVMQDTDAAMCTSIASVARDTGMAGGVKDAYLNGDSYVYGIVVDSNSISVTKPTSGTPGVNSNWSNNGTTAVNGDGFVMNTGVEEFVIEGGNPMPLGSYAFRMDDYGNIEILRRW